MTVLADEHEIAAALVRHARRAKRLRLEVPSLLGDGELAHRLERSIAAQAGVVHARANPRSGRVLVEYARDAEAIARLEAYARSAGPLREPTARRRHGARARTRSGPAVQLAAAWHAEDVSLVCTRLGTNPGTGLSEIEARRRLAELGPNVLVEDAPRSRLALFASQLANLPTALLLGSTVVSLLLGDLLEAGAIVAVLGLNATVGYRVERRSETLLASWREAEVGVSDVIRDGSLATAPAAELVPGDILVVRAGTVITGDARVIDAHRLAADEAPLTGESEPVAKSPAAAPVDAALADRTSMLYRGTTIASGHGVAVVVATGDATELASVQRLAAESRAPKGRLQARLDRLASRLAWSGLAASGAAAVASLAHGRPLVEILRDTVALGVAAIPEGLPVTSTAALVRAMARLRARGVIVRRLATAETLGAITVACTDKTGTLTENRMQVELVSLLAGTWVRRIPGARLAAAAMAPGPIHALLVACVLNSDIGYHRNGNGKLELDGSATERALVEAASRAGIDPVAIRRRWRRTRLVERRDGVHYVISEHEHGVSFMKGAPEQVVARCELSDAAARAVLAENDALAAAGLRVLAVAFRRTAAARRGPWQYLGLVAIRDPLRAGSVEALHAAERAGIRTIMLTGDQQATARAIASEAELRGDVIEGRELAELLAAPDADARLRGLGVVARVTPADKVAVVEALRRAGEVVAMIGDGINDAPALRAADVGIAVGARSTDLARQTADVVLEHADLRSILDAIAEGRAVQDNLRRSIRFQAAGNLGEILLAFGAAVAGYRLIPSLGLLWINLLTDTFPGLALALEPTHGRLLERAPLPPSQPILRSEDWRRIVRDGALIAAASGTAAVGGGPLAAFAAIGATQFGYAAASRSSDHAPSARLPLLVGGSAALHLLAVTSAPARALLRVVGAPAAALTSFTVGLCVPLYLGWRRTADVEIVRRAKETS